MVPKRLTVLCFLLMASLASGLQANGQGADTLAIRQVLQRQEDAWNRGDIPAFMEGYWKSDSLVFTGASGPTRGWQATLENLLAMEDKNIVIFRNPAKECLTLELKKSIEGKARVALVFQSAAEFEAQEKRLDEQAEKFKRQRAGQ